LIISLVNPTIKEHGLVFLSLFLNMIRFAIFLNSKNVGNIFQKTYMKMITILSL